MFEYDGEVDLSNAERLFCIRWNGLNKSGGAVDALDDAEYSGSVISLIENGEAFIKRNCKMKWRKTANSREEIRFLRMCSTGLDIWSVKVVDLERLLVDMNFKLIIVRVKDQHFVQIDISLLL